MFTISSICNHFCQPTIMGILNVTPDSFATHCSSLTPETILADFRQLVQQGAQIIDLGACSTRPNSTPVDEEEEWRRLQVALSAIRSAYPHFPVSIDTFRASVAQKALQQFRVQIINDISGLSDPQMLSVIAHAHVPYILTHPREACLQWSDTTPVLSEVLAYFAHQLDILHRAGVADVMIDPGLGFGKTIQQNYTILSHLSIFQHLNTPVLIGLSRKSMIYQPLHLSPADVLGGTTAAHTLALIHGANILRVHDVAEAKQAIAIVQAYQQTL